MKGKKTFKDLPHHAHFYWADDPKRTIRLKIEPEVAAPGYPINTFLHIPVPFPSVDGRPSLQFCLYPKKVNSNREVVRVQMSQNDLKEWA